MKDSRAGLQQLIRQYEERRDEAVRVQQEAETLLPLLRAAIEDLESGAGITEISRPSTRIASLVEETGEGKKRKKKVG